MNPALLALMAVAGAGAGAALAWYLARRSFRNRLAEFRTQAAEERDRMIAVAEEAVRDRQTNLDRVEKRLDLREKMLEDRALLFDQRETTLMQEQRHQRSAASALEERSRSIEQELMRIAGLTRTEAREIFLRQVEDEFREVGARRAKEVEAEMLTDIDRRARKHLLDVMQRSIVDYLTEATIAVVEIPNEEMKGRIIGREGRNIRSFEQITGVDLIIDETPDAVVLSSFDPVRREIARLALMNLMLDGRIHPGRIEELHEKASQEVDRMIREAGERAAARANVSGLTPRLIETLGKLRFRTSYAQNVLDHCVEVARLAENIAYELGLNAEVAKRAGLLHDIGKALGPEFEGPHAITGMEFLRSQNERESVLHAVGAHHHDIEPHSAEAIAVIIADTISASRPGARRENLETYLKRLAALEALANEFPGVHRSYAVQAGREIRLIVKPDELDDLGASRLAADVAKKIETEMDYPGQVKVTVIREFRKTEVAK